MSDKLLIVLHIAHENGVDGSKQTAETAAIKCHKLQASRCYNVGSARLVLEQCPLAEVVSLLVGHDFDGGLSGLDSLSCTRLATHDKIEDFSFLSLSDNVFTLIEPLLDNGIGKLRALVGLHVL